MTNNFVWRQWFSQKSTQASVHQAMKSISLNETGAEHYRHIRADFPEAMERLFAVHRRHR